MAAPQLPNKSNAMIPTSPPAEIFGVKSGQPLPDGRFVGAYGTMKIDVVVHLPTGDRVFENVAFANDAPDEYDIVVKLGAQVCIGQRGNELRFFVPWMPKLTRCDDPQGRSSMVVQNDPRRKQPLRSRIFGIFGAPARESAPAPGET